MLIKLKAARGVGQGQVAVVAKSTIVWVRYQLQHYDELEYFSGPNVLIRPRVDRVYPKLDESTVSVPG